MSSTDIRTVLRRPDWLTVGVVVLLVAYLSVETAGFDTERQCGSYNDAATPPVCYQPDYSCAHCVKPGPGLNGLCRATDRHREGPYYVNSPTPGGNGDICYEKINSLPCYTTCQCDDHDIVCSFDSSCRATHSNCSTSTGGPYWVASGICGQGSPCDTP